MILDNIKNCNKYLGVNEKFEKAFQFLQRKDLKELALGKYEIDGENIFAIIQQYETKELEGAKYEAHKKYIDIQYILDGQELIGYSYIDNINISKSYDEENDFMLLEGDSNTFIIKHNEFAIFFPEDAHMPGIMHSKKDNVKKIVVKIKL